MTASNREEITRQIATLQDRHGEAPVEREDLPFELPPGRFRDVVERARTETLNSSYVWVRRTPDQFPDPSASSPDSAAVTRPRVLFIYNRADDHTRTVPGGEQEPGESFGETALRELREETGIEATITGLRKIHDDVAVPAEPVEIATFEPVHAIYPIFEADYVYGKLDIQAEELYGGAWFDRMPDSLHRLIADQSIGPE